MMALKHVRMSIKTKILASILTAVLAVAAAGLVSMLQEVSRQSQRVLTDYLGYAKTVDESIAAQFFERYGDAQAFALNPILRDQRNPQAIAAYLDRYAALYGIYDLIIYVDTKGNFIASNESSPTGVALDLSKIKGQSFANAPWFKAVITHNLTEDKERNLHGTYVEDLMVDPIVTQIYGKTMYGNSFSAPVYGDNGEVIGVISNRANAIWVEYELRLLHKLLAGVGLDTARVSLVNRAGLLLLENGRDTPKTGEIPRNFDRLLKFNLAAGGSVGAAELVAGRSGSKQVENAVTGAKEVEAYGPLESRKWIPSIGWGVIVSDDASNIFAASETMLQRFMIVIGICTLAFSIIGLIFATSLSTSFIGVSDRLRRVAEKTTDTAKRLSLSSKSLFESTAEQSASVQETVSSMSEISSMISQTNQNVLECTSIAGKVSNRSDEGNQTMRRLTTAMESVSHANDQLRNIANIISEVSAKTMVINDIVFKTQLLSINASIEAARAGQHGKGFSVVAEEVGNLAQMSGNSAKEIQTLISDSQKQVTQIIEVTQLRTRESQAVANEALSAFTEIASGINSMSQRLQGVAHAAKEQEAGIQQINTAMSQVDEATQRNSQVSAESDQLAKDLEGLSVGSFRAVRALRMLVLGTDSEKEALKTDLIDRILGDQATPQQAGRGLDDSDDRHAPPSSDPKALQKVAQRLSRKLAGRGGAKKLPASEEADGKIAIGEDVDADDESFKNPA